MKKIYILTLTGLMVSGLFAQAPDPIQGDDGRFTNINVPVVKHNLESRATGTYYLDYLEYDKNLIGSVMQNGVYGNLSFTKTDTAFGAVPFVAEYYDSLVYSDNPTDPASWQSLSWSNVASMTVDSVFILLNVDNFTGTNDWLKMKIVTPTTVAGGTGNWRNFNTTPIWQDSSSTNIDIGTISGGSIGFDVVSFAPGVNVSNSFGLMFQFYGDPQDTCRLLWSYPTDNAGCATGVLADNPLAWQLYPTSFYNICLGGDTTTGAQIQSIGLPRITGTGTFGYSADCSAPATPFLGDVAPNFDPAKNPFQHWNIWAIVTMTDNLGIAEQTEKGIKVFAYPNPAADFLNIEFKLLKDADHVNLTITDLSGRTVISRTLGAFASGKNTSNVQIDLSSGVYTYSLDVDGTKITRKFIVNK